MANNNDLHQKWLNQQSDLISLVLNDNELHLFKSCHYIVKSFMTDKDYCPIFIACCLHDKDFEDDEQTRLETPHYQCVVYFKQKLAFKTIINLIKKLFPNVNENQIGIEKGQDLCALTRYVVHMGFFDKHQYSLDEVSTNDFDLFMKYYRMVSIKDQIDCVTVVKQFDYNLENIICNVSNFKQWRSIIKDLIIDSRQRGKY